MLPGLAAVVLSYLLGSTPWGLLLVRLVRGVDLRKVGSGNIGATNAMRAAGKPLGLFVFALDFAKGWLAIAVIARYVAHADASSWLAVACGVAAVVGHCFPIWLGFKGGKGVATGCGAIVAIEPWVWVVGGVLWLLALVVVRMVSLASILMGLAFPLAAWWWTRSIPATVGAGLLALLILVRHRSNMARILAGTEPRVFAKNGRGGASHG